MLLISYTFVCAKIGMRLFCRPNFVYGLLVISSKKKIYEKKNRCQELATVCGTFHRKMQFCCTKTSSGSCEEGVSALVKSGRVAPIGGSGMRAPG